jgi:FecR protein
MEGMPEAQMISSPNRANFPMLGFAVIFFAFALMSPSLSPAQERYPTVARISFVSGPVSYSRGDDPDEWDDAIENVPLTIGDRIYAPEDGRAELQLPSGNFVRLAPRSYFSALNLSDDIKQFYLGEGAASFNIRRLGSDEVIEIDTPNVSATLDQPGRYRIAVDDDGNSRISVRRGRVIVAAAGKEITVENSEIRIYGIDSPRYEIVALPATDAFDRWVAERDARFERTSPDAHRYASEEIIGIEDLSEYGRWEDIPEHGFAWTPSAVAAGWAPFSVGRWFWQDPWGWTWISGERWGWATSHYGRWTPYRSRWYWVPVRPRTRFVRYAPACVEFVRVRDHVGWFPLHPRDRFIPWWERAGRRSVNQNITYVNRTHVTVVNQNTFISARPIHRHMVRDSVIMREASSARMMSESLPVPNRSSLRVVSETGERRNHRPSANILARAAVVRTAPPAPPPTFQEKLPEIQKSQGHPIAPSTALALALQKDKTKPSRVPIRPAAVDASGGDFAPRTPGAASGPTPRPLTAARGKKLATPENPVDTSLPERAERAQKSPAQQPPLQPSPSAPSKGIAGKPELPRPEQERDRQRPEKQTLERERPAQQQLQKQQELERKQQEQQKEAERKAQLQQKQQEQERRQQLRQQQLQDHQAQEQQRQRELERRQPAIQKEAEHKAQLQQRQQEQIRREQLRQQQLQERKPAQPQIQQQRPELKPPLPQ